MHAGLIARRETHRNAQPHDRTPQRTTQRTTHRSQLTAHSSQQSVCVPYLFGPRSELCVKHFALIIDGQNDFRHSDLFQCCDLLQYHGTVCKRHKRLRPSPRQRTQTEPRTQPNAHDTAQGEAFAIRSHAKEQPCRQCSAQSSAAYRVPKPPTKIRAFICVVCMRSE